MSRRRWLGNLCAGLFGQARQTAEPSAPAAITPPGAGAARGGEWLNLPEPLSIVTYIYDLDAGVFWRPNAGGLGGEWLKLPDPFRYNAIRHSDMA